MVTWRDGMIAVVVGAKGLARIGVSPVQVENCEPPGGGFALTTTSAPAVVIPSPLPLLTVKVTIPTEPAV